MAQRIPMHGPAQPGGTEGRRPRWRAFLAPVLAALLGWLPGGPALPAEVVEDEIDVLEVQVPVNVVAPDGTPVRGLQAGDFEILDRGRRREIVAFRAVDLRALEPTPGRIDEEQLLPAEARRHFLLVFDLSFSRPGSVLDARQAARDFILESLHPTDLAAVMTFSLEHGLRLLVTFTSDRAQLARAVDTMGFSELLHEGIEDPLRLVIDSPSNAEASVARDGSPVSDLRATAAAVRRGLTSEIIGLEIDRQEKAAQRGRVAAWARALENLADLLAGVAGRKHVVYFSEGFDSRVLMGEGGRQEIERAELEAQLRRQVPVDSYERYGDISLLSELDRVLKELKKSDSMVQTVDISGGSSSGPGGGRHILQTLAHRTGGELVAATGELRGGLESVLDGSSVTYLLSFRAEGVEPDGSYHPIEVRADVPKGVVLSHRPGYYAPEPFGELHPLEKSLLTAEAIAAGSPRRDVGLQVLAAPFKSTAGRAYVPVIVEMDGSTLLREHEQATLPVEIYVYASDAKGAMQDFFTQLLTLDVAKGREALEGAGVKYYGHLELPPGDHLVRVLVRNAATGRTGVATARLPVPGFAGEDPALVGPFFPEAPGRWILVRERPHIEEESVVYPFTVGGEIYIPAARPELASTEPARLCMVAYNLGKGDLELEATVVTEEGDELEGGVLVLEERTVTGIVGYDKLLASFHPAGLEAGDYNLRVTVREEGSPLAVTSSVPFTVAD